MTKRLKLRGLASHLILYILIFSSFITLLGTALQLHLDYSRDVNRLENRLGQIEAGYLESIVNSVWVTDDELLRIQLEGILRLPDIRYVEVLPLHRPRLALGTLPLNNVIQRRLPLSRIYKEQEIQLGTLRIVAGLQGVYDRLWQRALVILLTQAVQTFLIAAFIFFLFYYLVGRHINLMAAYTRSLDPELLDTPLTLRKKSGAKTSPDELDQLVFSINQMRVNLKKTFNDLQAVNSRLAEEIKERAETAKALEASESRYRLLVNSIHEVFWIMTPDFNEVIFISPAYEEIWGLPCESLYQRPLSWIEAIVEEDRPAITALLDRLRREASFPARLQFPDYRVSRPDGTERWIQARAFPVFDEHGKLWRIAGICEDVTSRKLMEERLRQSQKMEAIGTLAGGIAHDFNNILFPLMGYTEMALEALQGHETERKYLMEVLAAANRAKELVQQILAFSRKAVQERRPLLLQPVIQEALKLMRATLPATIEIRQDITAAGEVILGDPGQMHQVLINLCTNAFHAMRQTGGILEVKLAAMEIGADPAAAAAPELAPGKYLKLTVSDTGHGMDRQISARIFEPYFTTKSQGDGTGLGLSVVHGIVRRHGGQITVYSEPGQGTVFNVYLPVIAAEEPALETMPAAQITPGTERLLVVDDEQQLADMIKRMLETLGYQVSIFTSSREALTTFLSRPADFDLVITDLTMPEMTGVELARRILAARPAMPIIMCTGFSELISKEEASNIGIRQFLMKPVTRQKLAQTIRQVLDGT